jgi:aflatoxin B1 aldehyde reductase
MYRQRYYNDAYFDALEFLRPVAKKYGHTEARWMTHHSLLKREFGDEIITGRGTMHLEENMKLLDDLRPLAEDVLRALDAGWEKVKGIQ